MPGFKVGNGYADLVRDITPGPWESDRSGDLRGDLYVRRVGAVVGEPAICKMMRSADRAENQRLVAAAPDLLAACEAALVNFDETVDSRRKWTARDQRTYDALLAALAKARGTP